LEARKDHKKLAQELNDHKKKMKNKIDIIHADISKFPRCVTQEGLSDLWKRSWNK
jgi:hypothetical protein